MTEQLALHFTFCGHGGAPELRDLGTQTVSRHRQRRGWADRKDVATHGLRKPQPDPPGRRGPWQGELGWPGLSKGGRQPTVGRVAVAQEEAEGPAEQQRQHRTESRELTRFSPQCSICGHAEAITKGRASCHSSCSLDCKFSDGKPMASLLPTLTEASSVPSELLPAGLQP